MKCNEGYTKQSQRTNTPPYVPQESESLLGTNREKDPQVFIQFSKYIYMGKKKKKKKLLKYIWTRNSKRTNVTYNQSQPEEKVRTKDSCSMTARQRTEKNQQTQSDDNGISSNNTLRGKQSTKTPRKNRE